MIGQEGGIWQWLGGADNVTATAIALGVLLGVTRAVWRRTVRRRSLLRSAINGLAIGVNEEYVRARLGSPTYGEVDAGNGYLAWVTPYANIAAVLQDGRVSGFVVTVTDLTFRFDPGVVTLGNVRGHLGMNTYEAAAGAPVGQYYSVGARRYCYSENYYHGNPSGYLHFGLSCSDSSAVGHFEIPRGAPMSLSAGERRDPGSGDLPDRERELLARIRRAGRPNTVAVWEFELKSPYLMDDGAIDGDQFRLLPMQEGAWLRLERMVARLFRARGRRTDAQSKMQVCAGETEPPALRES